MRGRKTRARSAPRLHAYATHTRNPSRYNSVGGCWRTIERDGGEGHVRDFAIRLPNLYEEPRTGLFLLLALWRCDAFLLDLRYSEHPPWHRPPVVKRFRSIFEWPPNQHYSLPLFFPLPPPLSLSFFPSVSYPRLRSGNRQTTFARFLQHDTLDPQIAADRESSRSVRCSISLADSCSFGRQATFDLIDGNSK